MPHVAAHVRLTKKNFRMDFKIGFSIPWKGGLIWHSQIFAEKLIQKPWWLEILWNVEISKPLKESIRNFFSCWLSGDLFSDHFFMSDTIWLTLGAVILKKTKPISEDQFRSTFKLPTKLATIVWKRLIQIEGKVVSSKHFLWTLHFLKSPNPSHNEIALFLGTNYKTMKFHVFRVLNYLKNALPGVWFNFLSRFLLLLMTNIVWFFNSL